MFGALMLEQKWFGYL